MTTGNSCRRRHHHYHQHHRHCRRHRHRHGHCHHHHHHYHRRRHQSHLKSPVSNTPRPLDKKTKDAFMQGKPQPEAKYSQMLAGKC